MSIKLGNYLFTRLKQLGVNTVFGVPGDYELALLDLIGESGVEFSGNANELIASYAADGYGRVKGVGAFVTTFGPGELSAYCGHAGAYTEHVPVAHIIGYPGRPAMDSHALMHHTLGTGEFGMYHDMARYISCDTTVLLDPKTAPSEIDRVLNTMLHESRPVYIGVPVDVSHLEVDASGLKSALRTALPPNDAKQEQELVSQLRDILEQKQDPIFIIDGNAVRGSVVAESRELCELTGLPFFTTCMGKGGPDESLPNFGGVYQGAGTYPKVAKAVESSDAVFWIGNVQTDFNTGEFTDNVAEDVTIEFQRFFVKIGKKQYDLKMVYVLRALIESIKAKPLARTAAKITWDPYPENDPKPEETLTQDYLWPTLGKFFRPGDFVIGETGTSAFGLTASILPKGATMYNQTVFGSIGYATGAALGALKAIREMGHFKRLILCTGEGSLHLTVQAFADFLKLELNPIVFVLNNDGYTVERLIHGRDAFYNQLPYWDYSQLAPAFGPRFPQKYYGPIDTPAKLDELLANQEFAKADRFQLVELKLGYLDAPLSLRMAASAVEEFNKRKVVDGSMGATRVAPQTVRVAVTQHEPIWLDLEATVTKTCSIIAEAASAGAKLVVFPECWIPGYPAWIWSRPVDFELGVKYVENSLRVNGPQMRRIQESAAAHGINVGLGFSERDGESVYISQALIDEEGEIRMKRRKMKPTHMERTIFGDASGDCLASVVQLADGGPRVGSLSCWEHIQPLLKYYTLSQNEQIHIAAWPPLDPFVNGSPGFWSMTDEGEQS